MSSLDEARKKIEERRQQQSTRSSSTDLWMRKDDLVICHSIFTGGDNDPYFEVYVAHEEPSKGQGQYSTTFFCPVESGVDGNYDCRGCRDRLKTKERMAMWFWVYDILHQTLKSGESFPQVAFNNKQYFRREVNGPKFWDASAWRESPLDDILMLGSQLGGNIQSTRLNLMTTGENLTKRFKIYMEPNTPGLEPEIFEEAKKVVIPVFDMLMARLQGQPTESNPDAPSSQAAPVKQGDVLPYTPAAGSGSVSVPAYNPGSTAVPQASTTKKNMF